MINVASIVTQNHVERALTMFSSMLKFRNDCHLDLLVVTGLKEQAQINLKNVTIHHIEDFYEHKNCGLEYRLTVSKYASISEQRPSIIAPADYLRWSLKPVFTNILLENYNRVYFCDHDLYFYNDFTFLDEEANGKTICLSPHWRTISHTAEQEYEYNFKHGLYNGGFFIANKEGKPILRWWSEMCIHKCTAVAGDATYVDQKYLDVVPLYFDNVHIIKHKGCNVAAWNRTYNKRTISGNKILVGGNEIIFIHYSPVTERHIENGRDALLQEHLKQYKTALLETKTELLRSNMNQFTFSGSGTNLV